MTTGSDIPAHLTSLIYAAATDKSKWQDFCTALHAHTSAPIKIFGHSTKTSESLGFLHSGWSVSLLEQYHEYYGALNPWMHMNLTLKPGEVGVSDDALPRKDLFRTEFYNDWLRHQENIVAGPAMLCYRSDNKLVALVAACRSRGADEQLPEMVSLLKRASPHITRSIELSSALMNGGGRSMSHLAASRHAVILLHRSGRIGYCNPKAQGVLQDCSNLYVGYDGRLTARDENLRTFLSAAADAMAAESFEFALQPVILNSAKYGQCMLHAHVFPALGEMEFPDSVWSDPVTGCFVITGRFGLDGDGAFSDIAKAIGATPAEAKLAGALMQGTSLYEYADRSNLSRHTVRNQMRALLSKSGQRSQSDLIAWISALLSPFSQHHG